VRFGKKLLVKVKKAVGKSEIAVGVGVVGVEGTPHTTSSNSIVFVAATQTWGFQRGS